MIRKVVTTFIRIYSRTLSLQRMTFTNVNRKGITGTSSIIWKIVGIGFIIKKCVNDLVISVPDSHTISLVSTILH